MGENSTLTDALLLSGGNGLGFGNNGVLWLFLLLGFTGFNNGGFGNRSNVATTEDLASAFNFNGLQGKTNDILTAINGVNQNLGNAICQSSYQNAKDFGEMSRQIADCCCSTQLGIKDVRFDMANYTAAINANTTASTQKILDALATDRMAKMQDEINSLRLNSALCGIPRISTYAYGVYPYPTYNPCGGQMSI